MSDSPRSSAAKAKRAARLNQERSSSSSRPSVKYSNLTFTIDSETERQIEEERSKVRDTLSKKA